MSGNNHHIDALRLKRYYSHEMSQQERHALELEALNDPFLREAMDGFDENPGSFDQFYAKHQNELKPRNSYTFTIAISVLLVLFIGTALLMNKFNRSTTIVNNEPEKTEIDSLKMQSNNEEIEVINPVIDSMSFISEEEQIKTVDVIQDQAEIKILSPKKVTDEKISVPEEIQNSGEKLEPEKENWNWYQSKGRAIPTAYVYGFKVVDYREIKRENSFINYKRYELGGVAANQENENTQAELIEQEVEIPYFNYLTKTMSFFEDQNFKASLNRHLIILEQYPEDLNALFYSGLAYYNLGRYNESIDFFNHIIRIDNEVFNQEAEWYRAKSLVQLGKKSEARTALEEIIMKGGFYVEDAIKLKAKLK